MISCPRCGSENSEKSAVCRECGSQLKVPTSLAATMLGNPGSPLAATAPPVSERIPPEPAPSKAADRPNPKDALKSTMLGMPAFDRTKGGTPVAEGDVSGPAAAQPGGTNVSPLGTTMPLENNGPSTLKNTVLGMPSPLLRSDTKKSSEAKSDTSPFKGTLIGMTSPVRTGSSPTTDVPSVERTGHLPVDTLSGVGQSEFSRGAPPPRQETPTSVAKTPATEGRKFASTLLGVARPGIAPSQNYAAPPHAHKTMATAFDGERDSHPSPSPSKPRWSTPLFIAGGIVVAASLGAGLATLKAPAVVVSVTKFSIDNQGNDQLSVSCRQCPNGSQLTLDGASATVVDGEALLIAKTPLKLGRNELQFYLTSKGEAAEKTEQVVVPISFRVSTNWIGGQNSPPFANVVVTAPEKSEVTIDGQKVLLVGTQATQRIVFDAETLGEAQKVETVQRKIAVTVTSSGKTRHTTAILNAGVTPLTILSPAPEHRLLQKPLTIRGTTSPDAEVTINDQKFTADKQGLFNETLENPQPGGLTIEARTKKLITRRVVLNTTKSSPVAQTQRTKYSAIKAFEDATVEGHILSTKIEHGITFALIEVREDCHEPPCLVRAVYGEPLKLSEGKTVVVHGRVTPGEPLTLRANWIK